MKNELMFINDENLKLIYVLILINISIFLIYKFRNILKQKYIV